MKKELKQKLIEERLQINSEYYHTVMNGEADSDVIGLDNKHLFLALRYVPNKVLKSWIRDMKKEIKEKTNKGGN